MWITVNKFKYINSYAKIGSIESGIEITNKDNIQNLLDYQYINDELIYNPIPKNKPIGVSVIYDGSKWIEEGSLEEQEIFYRNKIIELNKKIIEIESVGFGASNLKIELESLKLKHQEVTHLLGLEIDKTII